MPSLEHWVRGGVKLTRTTHSGSINGLGTQTSDTQTFTFPSNYEVTKVNGAFTEFSASSFTNLKGLVNDVTGDGIDIPTDAAQSLFGGNYSDKAFFANASNSDNVDFKGNGDHINPSSASIVDGVVGN